MAVDGGICCPAGRGPYGPSRQFNEFGVEVMDAVAGVRHPAPASRGGDDQQVLLELDVRREVPSQLVSLDACRHPKEVVPAALGRRLAGRLVAPAVAHGVAGALLEMHKLVCRARLARSDIYVRGAQA